MSGNPDHLTICNQTGGYHAIDGGLTLAARWLHRSTSQAAKGMIAAFRSPIHFILACGVILAGCTQNAPSQTDPLQELIAQSERQVAQAYELEKRRSINENWIADCTTDVVTSVRRCFAAAFGQYMDAKGNGFGGKNISFQVYFFNQDGPFILVGTNTYPGRTPTVRLDDGEPITVLHFGGTQPPLPQPDLVEQLREARTARARFYVWPDGSSDMIVDVRGFDEAWRTLLAYVGGGTAPSEETNDQWVEE